MVLLMGLTDNRAEQLVKETTEMVEVDDDVEELQRLDRARVLIKTPWQPIFQHVASTSINGEEYTMHISITF